MYTGNYNQYLKLVLPSNEIITIQLCSDEIEFKDLLSTVTNINSSSIKGFKDSFGNYFTFSSIKSSYNPNEIYSLIIDNNNNNDIININTINSININNNEYNIINNNINSNLDNNLDYYENKNNNNTKKNKHYYRTFSYDKNNHILYKNYLIQLFNNYIINKEEFNFYSNMINNNNKEIINKFELFFHGKMSEKDFFKYLKLYNNNNLEQDFLDAIYKKLSNYFDDNKNEILRQLIKYENENLKKCILKYKLDKDFEKLFEETKKCIDRFNERKNKKIFVNLRQSIELNKYIRHNSSPQASLVENNKKKKLFNKKDFNNNNKVINLFQYKLTNKPKKKSNGLSSKKSEIEKYIKKYNIKLFHYIYNNISEEKNNFKKIFGNNEDKKDKKIALNKLIQDYINKELITYAKKFNNNYNLISIDLELLQKLLKEKNIELINLYENFNNDFETLLNDIITILNKYKYKKSKTDDNINKNFKEFFNIEDVLNYFIEFNICNEEQISYFKNNYDTDQKLITYFNNYLENNDKNNLIISIDKHLKKKIKKSKEFTFGIKKKNNSSIIHSKTNQIEDEDNNNMNKNSEENVNENKQKTILKKLLNENLIDQNTYNIVLKKFDMNDINVISAFNVYGYTKNSFDFIETLQILSEIHDNNCEDTFNYILNNGNFNNQQKKKLVNLFNENNKNLINLLKTYENSNIDILFEKITNFIDDN